MRRVKSQERRVESQKLTASRCARALALDSRLSTLDSPARGVTLIELLITIMIISILAGLSWAWRRWPARRPASSTAAHIVARLHTLLMEHYDTYKTRRVRLQPDRRAEINDEFASNAERGQACLAEARLYALREMMLMEVPDRWSDVLLNAVPTIPPAERRRDIRSIRTCRWISTARTRSGERLFAAILQRLPAATNTVTGHDQHARRIIDNQGAECLYMVITLASGDGEARTLFGESSIGDTDGDGAPEFLDGWGHPIEFPPLGAGLRFADSDQCQSTAGRAPIRRPGERPASPKITIRSTCSASIRLAFRLVPLIFSAGRDEEFGHLRGEPTTSRGRKSAQSTVNTNRSGAICSRDLRPTSSIRRAN